nr:hypothetical protein [Nocardioides mesophilus]
MTLPDWSRSTVAWSPASSIGTSVVTTVHSAPASRCVAMASAKSKR